MYRMIMSPKKYRMTYQLSEIGQSPLYKLHELEETANEEKQLNKLNMSGQLKYRRLRDTTPERSPIHTNKADTQVPK